MRLILCLEMFEIKFKFQKWSRKFRKSFNFLDNFILIGVGKFSILQRKYFSPGVNVLRNGLKISDISKEDFFQLTFSQNDEQC